MSLVGEVVLVVGVGRGHDRIASLDAKEQWGGGLLLSSGLFAQSSITMGGGGGEGVRFYDTVGLSITLPSV